MVVSVLEHLKDEADMVAREPRVFDSLWDVLYEYASLSRAALSKPKEVAARLVTTLSTAYRAAPDIFVVPHRYLQTEIVVRHSLDMAHDLRIVNDLRSPCDVSTGQLLTYYLKQGFSYLIPERAFNGFSVGNLLIGSKPKQLSGLPLLKELIQLSEIFAIKEADFDCYIALAAALGKRPYSQEVQAILKNFQSYDQTQLELAAKLLETLSTKKSAEFDIAYEPVIFKVRYERRQAL